MNPIIEQKPSLDYLVHYGVPGMKWGVRREKRLAAKRDRQYKQLEKAYYSKGVLSKSFREKAQSLNITKAKHKLAKVKNSGGSESDKIAAKVNLKEAKRLKKWGTAGDGTTKEMYDPKGKFKLTKNDMVAINQKEISKNNKTFRREQIGRTAASVAIATIGSLAVKTAISQFKVKQETGHFGKIKIGKLPTGGFGTIVYY